MLQRAAFLYVLFVFAVIAGGAAVWQALELNVRDRALGDLNKAAATSRREMQIAADTALSAERRARIAEHDLKALQQSIPADAANIETLRAELAAAHQQLATVETAVTETEAQLSAEITAHVALKTKSAEIASTLADAEKKLADVKADAAAAQQKSAASVPVSRVEPNTSTPSPAAQPAPAVPENPVTENPAKASGGASKKTVTIERPAARKPQAKQVVKRATKTVKEPETKAYFPMF